LSLRTSYLALLPAAIFVLLLVRYLPITALVLAFFLPGKNFFLNLQKTLDIGAQNR